MQPCKNTCDCDDKQDFGLEFLRASAHDYEPLGCGPELCLACIPWEAALAFFRSLISAPSAEVGLSTCCSSLHVLGLSLRMNKIDDESDAVWDSLPACVFVTTNEAFV